MIFNFKSISIIVVFIVSLSDEFDREALCDQVVVLEHDHNIHLKLHLERLCRDWRAREESGEYHMESNGYSPGDVALRDLDVLDLRRLLRVALRAAARLHPDQLHLDGLDGRLALLNYIIPKSEWTWL